VNQVASLNDFIDPCVEVVIKVSQLISCSFGTGHIVLTHDRQVALAVILSLLIFTSWSVKQHHCGVCSFSGSLPVLLNKHVPVCVCTYLSCFSRFLNPKQ